MRAVEWDEAKENMKGHVLCPVGGWMTPPEGEDAEVGKTFTCPRCGGTHTISEIDSEGTIYID